MHFHSIARSRCVAIRLSLYKMYNKNFKFAILEDLIGDAMFVCVSVCLSSSFLIFSYSCLIGEFALCQTINAKHHPFD